jgi:hypothetical protein
VTFDDKFLPIKTEISFVMETKFVVRVQGAKSNVFHSTFNVIVDLKVNPEKTKGVTTLEEVRRLFGF